VTSPNSRFFSDQSENQSEKFKSDGTETNRLDNAFKAVKEKSGSLDHFNKSLVVVKQEEDCDYTLPHPIWTKEETENVTINHRKPLGFVDKAAYSVVSLMRLSFDVLSGYKLQRKLDTLDERSVLNRCIFLETVAGVPGFAAGMIRHLHSLRRMKRDHGWIHTLIEEAENERMHLMTFLQLRHPGPFFRAAVISSQVVFTLGFSLCYLISPRFCHRFVGYLEEQAVITYSDILDKIDEGKLPMWSNLPAPEIAVNYWKLGDSALMRDVILAIRLYSVPAVVMTLMTYDPYLELTKITTGRSTTLWGTSTSRRRIHLDLDSKY